MKFLFDFLPLLVFFAAYAAVDIFFATAAAMAATTLQIACGRGSSTGKSTGCCG